MQFGGWEFIRIANNILKRLLTESIPTGRKEKDMKRILTTFALIIVLSLVLGLGTSIAADKEVTIGYQLVYNPHASAILDGTFENSTPVPR
jgi:hypothetical protein